MRRKGRGREQGSKGGEEGERERESDGGSEGVWERERAREGWIEKEKRASELRKREGGS